MNSGIVLGTVFAVQLLEEPIRRILGYGGGELEITEDPTWLTIMDFRPA